MFKKIKYAKKFLFPIFLLLILMLSLSFVIADEVVVGVKHAPPFVIVEGNDVSGFSIDLIELLLGESNTISYHIDPDVPTHIASAQNNEIDVGIAASTITATRENIVDFSHPFYESSIGIMTKKKQSFDFLSLFTQREMLIIILVFIIYIAVCGHIIWFLEKGDGVFDTHYIDGVARGMWWTIVTMSTVGYGDMVPIRTRGKLFGSVVIISGILLFGIITAQLSSIMTLSRLDTGIEGPDDLVGKHVAVIAGTQTQTIAQEMGFIPFEVQNIEEGVQSVHDETSLAFIHDTPLLQYHMRSLPANTKILLLESTFSPSPYGMIFPENSTLREQLNIALLTSFEDGSYAKIKNKWFGI